MEHGKAASYNHGCHCPECAYAHARRHAEQRKALAARAAAGDPATPHGTEGGYKNWVCRCVPCTAANTAAVARYREGRRRRGGGLGFEDAPRPVNW